MSESERERRQRLAASSALQRVMPDLSKVFAEIAQTQRLIPQVQNLYPQAYLDSVTRLTSQLGSVIPPEAFNMGKIFENMPALKIDYASLFPNLAEISESVRKSLLPTIELINSVQYEQFAELIEKVQLATQAMLPPNWRGGGLHIPSNLEVLLLDEGLALAWVPPHDVVRDLFAAPNAQARRRILSSRWRGISTSCLEQVQVVNSPQLQEHVVFAVRAGEALRAGHWDAAQALSANLLDTILRKNFSDEERREVTGQKNRLNIDDYPPRVAIVFGGIWGSFGQFWTNNGDLIPRQYSRHGSAHGVSRRQYSRINSLIALMHVVSLLKLLDSDPALTKTTRTP